MLVFRRRRHRHGQLVVGSIAAVVIAVVSAGCGSVATGKGEESTFEVRAASTSADGACTASAATMCERAKACSAFLFSQVFTSVATCTSVFAERCVDRYRGPGAAPEIADCSALVSSMTCADLLDRALDTFDSTVIVDACPVTPGVFAAGERCLRDGDCVTGSCAWHDASGRQTSCGSCVAARPMAVRRRAGEACDSSEQCATRSCSAGRCAEVAELGEACGAERSCDTLPGLTCGSDARCRPYGRTPVGQPCPQFDLCEPGARCTWIDDQHSYVCTALPTAGVGEDCSLQACAHELTCLHQKCAAPSRSLPKSCAPVAPVE